MLLHGIFAPLTTPFYPDGKIYFRKLEQNVEQYSRTPLAGLVALGSSSETVFLSDEERREALKVIRENAASGKVLIAGTGMESVQETLKLTEHAANLGYDAALVRTPFFFRPQMSPEVMLNFYRTVADRSALPALIYSVAPYTAYDLPANVVNELAEHPNIIGIKDSSGDVEKVRVMAEGTKHIRRTATVTEVFAAVTPRMMQPSNPLDLLPADALMGGETGAVAVATKESKSPPKPVFKTRSKEVGFQVLSGSAKTLEPSLSAGAVGAVLAFADCAPFACYEIYAAWKEGDPELARQKQERIAEASTMMAGKYGVPGVKYAMEVNGYYGGPPRMPLLPLTAAEREHVAKLMQNIRS